MLLGLNSLSVATSVSVVVRLEKVGDVWGNAEGRLPRYGAINAGQVLTPEVRSE
jgi:hypothetical protein